MKNQIMKTKDQNSRITTEVKAVECRRCLLTNEVPGVKIAEDGLCSVCKEYDQEWGNWHQKKKERSAALDKILENAKKKNRLYDVCVPISGGKDSMYILYLLRQKYNLKCLAVTFDNGFLTNLARENIKNACEILGVDHIYYSISKPQLMKLYRYFFLKTGFFCPVCMRGIYVAQMRAQTAFNIPLAVKGSSRRTEEHISPEFFLPGDISFIENVLKGSPLEKKAELLLIQSGLTRSLPTIQLPDYIEWNYDEVFHTIKTKLNWKEDGDKTEHSDCLVAGVVDYARRRKYSVLVPEMLRFSKLVTCGQISKEEAIKKLSEEKKEIHEPGNLDWFMDELRISKSEFEEVFKVPLPHMKYLKRNNPVIRRIKSLKKKRLRLV